MLTAKQENFVELLTQGDSPTSAYNSSYDTQNMSDKTSGRKPQGSGDTPR